jgi:YD repeat-containing protein
VSLAFLLLFGPSLPALAQQILYEYDALGRLTVIASPDGVARYEYDAVGNILRIITRRYADVSGPVAILMVNPTQGIPGTTVRLYGKGFSPAAADNQVGFSGTSATVTAATASTLTVTVPSGATTGPITLTTPFGSATSPEPFTVLSGFVTTPDQADVALGGTLGFQATLDGTPVSAVTWRVNGTIGGSATLGTITAAGLYTAPSSPPPVQPIQVEAVLTADPTQIASATVRVVGQVAGLSAAPPVSVRLAAPALNPVVAAPVSVTGAATTMTPTVSAPVSVSPAPPPAALVGSGPLSVTGGPLIRAVSPPAAPPGTTALALTLTGANLQGASGVRFLRNGSVDSTLTASSLIPAGDGTSLSFSLAISGGAASGPRVVQVVTPQGTSSNFDLGTNVFTVTP